jgi:hypothetical protein
MFNVNGIVNVDDDPEQNAVALAVADPVYCPEKVSVAVPDEMVSDILRLLLTGPAVV